MERGGGRRGGGSSGDGGSRGKERLGNSRKW